MAKRFKSLEAALGYLRNPGIATDTPNPQAPAGTQLRRYQEYVAGERTVTYGPRAAGSKPGEIIQVELHPFALDAASTGRILAPMSQRAFNNMAETGMSAALLNIATTFTTGVRQRGFKPAKAVIARVGTGTTTPESKITGKRYLKTGGTSYTFPFGQGATAGESSMAEVQTAITSAVQGLTGSYTLTFQPELYR